MMEKNRVDREKIRHLIAEEAAHWDETDTSAFMGKETEWLAPEWSEREDRCDRCGGRMDTRRIDLHLAGGRVTLHNVTWYVCRTPGCGQTRLSPTVEQLARDIEASVEQVLAVSPAEARELVPA
jgi:hypothetical protein